MEKTTRHLLIAGLAGLFSLAASGCATTGAPAQFAAAETVRSDAAPVRHQWNLNCAGQARDASLQASRCARAELVRTIGPAAPTLSY